MRKSPILFILALAVLFGGAAIAQECPVGCDKAPQAKETKTLSAKVESLAAAAAKGDQSSADKLASLQKIANVDSVEALKTYVADYEKYACAGCNESAKVLAKLEAALKPAAARLTLSTRVEQLVANAKNGCGKSDAALAPLFEGCETKCCKSLVKQIRALEQNAATLAKLDAKIPGKGEAVSARVAKLSSYAENGCTVSKETLAGACEGCCEGCEKECCTDMVGWVKNLEVSAAKLAKLETMLPAASPPVPPKAGDQAGTKSKDCSDCGDCGDCSGGCPGGSAKQGCPGSK